MSIKKFNKIVLFFLIHIFIFIQSACLVSRLSRPRITGYIFDYDTKLPISGCIIGHTFTDSSFNNTSEKHGSMDIKTSSLDCNDKLIKILTYTNHSGYYELNEMRYLEFTWIGNEAPPLFVRFVICKEGYEAKELQSFSIFGGAAVKGSHWIIDPIYLKRNW